MLQKLSSPIQDWVNSCYTSKQVERTTHISRGREREITPTSLHGHNIMQMHNNDLWD